MVRRLSLKLRLVSTGIVLVVVPVLLIEGFSLRQFVTFGDLTMQQSAVQGLDWEITNISRFPPR
jgi:hypothetical protein